MAEREQALGDVKGAARTREAVRELKSLTPPAPTPKTPGQRAWATRRARETERQAQAETTRVQAKQEARAAQHVPRVEEPTGQKAMTFEPRGAPHAEPQRALGLGAPRPLPSGITIRESKSITSKKTAAERQQVVQKNAEHFQREGLRPHEALRKAEALNEAFGDRSPTIDELKKGYGAPGLKTEVSVTASFGGANIHATVTHPDGERVTQNFSRRYERRPDGTLSVEHVHFAVDPGFRSGGVGKQLLANSVRLQHELGMRHLHTGPAGSDHGNSFDRWSAYQSALRGQPLPAGAPAGDKATFEKMRDAHDKHKSGEITGKEYRKVLREGHAQYYRGGSGYVGPHAWANMGFQWSRGEGDRIGNKFASYLESQHGMSRGQAKKIADDLKHRPQKLVKYKLPNGKEAGSHFMSEFVGSGQSHWEIKIERGNKNWEHMKTKLGLEDLDP